MFLALISMEDYYVGDDAERKRQLLTIRYPVERGLITNWDDMEKLWQHTFSELGVSLNEHPVLLTDIPNNPKINREKMTQIMFEAFQAPAVFIAIQGVLSLYASGRLTGIVFNSGAGVSQIVPVNKGYAFSNASNCLPLGGQDVNWYLMDILKESGVFFNYQNPIKDVCEMKEKFCYVALDLEQEIQKTNGDPNFVKSYKLPDDQIITIGSEQFQCPEALFQPLLMYKNFDGIHKMCYDSITKCDDDIRKELFANVVLSGGSTMFPGIVERMKKELVALAPANTRVNVIGVPKRKYNVWIGGSILASQSTMKEMWLSRQEYEEFGPSFLLSTKSFHNQPLTFYTFI